jgi:Uma2 family endonuclease
MSPDDSLGSIQERIDDYLEFGVPNIWLIDPWKRKCWSVSGSALQPIHDGVLRTADGRVMLPLSEVIGG